MTSFLVEPRIPLDESEQVEHVTEQYQEWNPEMLKQLRDAYYRKDKEYEDDGLTMHRSGPETKKY